MIKLKMIDILKKFSALKDFTNLPLPVKVSYWMGRASNIIDRELETYYTENSKISAKLMEEFHALKNEDGTYQIDKDGMPQWETPEIKAKADAEAEKELKVLGDIEVEFPFEPLDINLLSGVNIKPATLGSLEEFFTPLK